MRNKQIYLIYCFYSDRSQYTDMFIPKRRKCNDDYSGISQTSSQIATTINIKNNNSILASGTIDLTTNTSNTNNILDNQHNTHYNSNMNADSSSMFSLSLPSRNNSNVTDATNNNLINQSGEEHDRHQSFKTSLESNHDNNNSNPKIHNNITSYSSALTSFSSFTCGTPPPPASSEYTTPLNWFQPINPQLFVDVNSTSSPGDHHNTNYESFVENTDKSGSTTCQQNNNHQTQQHRTQYLSHTSNYNVPTSTTAFVSDRDDVEQKISAILVDSCGGNQTENSNNVVLGSRI